MNKEIGSNLYEYNIDNKKKGFFWWEKKYNTFFFKSGRNAMRAIAELLSTNSSNNILVPAYLCETEIDSWREIGWNVYFYEINIDFTINYNSLDLQITKYRPLAILVQGYYGFDTIGQDVKNRLEVAQKEGTYIIEDLTQSLFTNYHLPFADFYTGSLRKFYATPDGGFLFSGIHTLDVKLLEENDSIDNVAQEAYQLKRKYFLTNDNSIKVEFRKKFEELAHLIDLDDKLYKISKLSKMIFDTLDLEYIKKKRFDNYNFLYKNINDISDIDIPLPMCSDGDTPLYLPIYFKSEIKRDDCRKYLSENNIYCPILWKKLVYYNIDNCSSKYIYDHILCIPIDQRYNEEDMKVISREIKKFINSRG